MIINFFIIHLQDVSLLIRNISGTLTSVYGRRFHTFLTILLGRIKNEHSFFCDFFHLFYLTFLFHTV